jgi:hypothetical protein
MSGRLIVAVSALTVAAGGAGVVALALPGGSNTSSLGSGLGPGGPPDAAVRGCRQRVEGRTLRARRDLDTIVGPIAFMRAGETYRHYAKRPDSALQPHPGLSMPAMKVLALVRAGSSVTLVVPKRQRGWMKLVYGQTRRGAYAITLRACRRSASEEARARECGWPPYRACRSRTTQFSGGFGLDFADAPRRGRCAKLVVWVAASKKPLRRRLFKPASGACPAEGGGITGKVILVPDTA